MQCLAALPPIPASGKRGRERERERAGNFLQTSCENTRNRKLLRKTLNAMLVRPSACPLLSPSAVFSSSSSSVSASGPVPQLTALTALSSQFSVRPPLCVCLSVCLFGSSFRLPVSVSVAVSASVSSSLLSLHLLLSLVYNKSAAPRLYLYLCPGLAWPARPCGTLSAASNTSMFILQVKRK